MSKKDELLLRIREGGKLSTSEQLQLTAMLSLPAILAQVSSILMFYIDDAMVGSLGARASASIGIVATSMWLFWSIISCAATGFSVQVAHRVGANDIAGARSVFRQSLMASMALALVTGAVGALISNPLPHWLGGSHDICSDASTYFLIFTLGAPLAMIDMLASAMLRCAGNIKVPSVANIVMCILDVCFNFLLIFPTRTVDLFGHSMLLPGAGLGVAGAAIGTVTAEGVVALYLMWYASTRCPELRLVGSRGSFVPEKPVLSEAGSIAGPIFLQRVLMNVAQITITVIVAPLGAIAIAANALGITAESLCYMPGYGIGEAATTLVGQSFGAGRRRLTIRFAWMTTLLGVAVMTLMGAVMYMAAPLMMASLTPDEAVRQLGTECLRIEAWAEPGFAASIVAMSVFVGAGDTRRPAMLNLFSMWAVRVTLAALLAPHYGLHGVWLGMAIELTFRGIIFLVRMKRGRWLRKIKVRSQ
ncbi:MAG: MATE family efflux transporter [Bacteroidaceae bacterium]|nr:MATE family efflux transporter [Bacteroidaceae bacterium]MBQ9190203.1 MATE family efflux transporter [Bacteroidaceae bacterium]